MGALVCWAQRQRGCGGIPSPPALGSEVGLELFNIVLSRVKEAKDIDPTGLPVNPKYQEVIVNQRFAVALSL